MSVQVTGITQTSPQRVPSAFQLPSGEPRFELMIPQSFLQDAGVGYLHDHEVNWGGYEYATRAFLDAHLTPETTFVDVGAHWGVFALHALTAPRGVKRVIAIEADPVNLKHLKTQISHNKADDQVTVIASAAGAEIGEAPLVQNSTMGHSINGLGLPPKMRNAKTVNVPVAPLDHLLADVLTDTGPVILKIDVEGFEPEVWQGMKRLRETGRVAAVIWEKGYAFSTPEREAAMTSMLSEMAELGFSQYRFAHPDLAGPLFPYCDSPESLNVFALAKTVKRQLVYGDDKPRLRKGLIPPLSRFYKPAPAGPARAAVTRAVMAAKATDAVRWVDASELSPGADERVDIITTVLPFDVYVVDVGCGLQRLRRVVKRPGKYTPADIVRWTPDTLVCDLNSGHFPRGAWDCAVLSHVLEYLHDPVAVLRRMSRRAHRLILLLMPPVDDYLEQGRFWSAETHNIDVILQETGWVVHGDQQTPQGRLIEARRLSLI